MSGTAVGLLLVEDNDFDVKRVMRGLNRLGDVRPVTRARDGVEALEILRRNSGTARPTRPFVVMLDLNMPRMSGIEFLDEIRADEELRETPVFVVTTSDYHVDIDKAYRRLVSGYFVKPDSAEEMVSVLGTLTRYWDTCLYPE